MAVTWHGMDELQRNLDTLARDIATETRPIAEQHAQAAADQIRARYPVVKGRLRAGVQVHAHTGGPFGVRYQVISTAPYASYYEYGTSRQPAGKVFVPIAIKERRAMRSDIGEVLESYGATVRGDV